MTELGCEKCYGTDAEVSHRHFATGCDHDGILVDDSHFIVGLRHCRACSQRFVSVFTEFVDWSGGDDAQYTTYMPVTEAEAAALVAGSLDVHDVGDLGGDRRHLNVDWPTGAPQRLNWLHGPFSVMEGY